MSDNDNARGPRFGIDWRLFLTGVGVAFIVLKLTGHVTWDWWIVLAPIWIPFGFWCAILIIGAVLIQASRLFNRKD